MQIQRLNSMALAALLLGLTNAWAATAHDGSDIPECASVTPACMNANVTATSAKTGKAFHGYQPGQHKNTGEGLWIDCVVPLSQGKTVPGVENVSADNAKACLKAQALKHHSKVAP